MAENEKGRYYWLKLKQDFFQRKDIKYVCARPGGGDRILFYLKLLCQSVSTEGELRFSERVPYDEEMLSLITDTPPETVRESLELFYALGMLDRREDGTITVCGIRELVGSGAGTPNAERQTRYRDRKKAAAREDGEDEQENGPKTGNAEYDTDAAARNADVTARNADVTEPITDRVTKSNESKSKSKSQSQSQSESQSQSQSERQTQSEAPSRSDPALQNERPRTEKDPRVECGREKTVKRFSPPTLEQVRAYCEERNNGVDARRFTDYYASVGWQVGKHPMKDWRAAVRTWENSCRGRDRPAAPRVDDHLLDGIL